MIARLTANEIDVSMFVPTFLEALSSSDPARSPRPSSLSPPSFSALTESLIAGIVKGSKAYKMIGSYVKTPLNCSSSLCPACGKAKEEESKLTSSPYFSSS